MKICYHCMTQIKYEKQNICPCCGKPLIVEPVGERFLRPGTLLNDKYLVGYPLGNGGFGNTYIGWDEILSRKVTIKEFYLEQCMRRNNDGNTVSVTTEQFRSRFQKGLERFIKEASSIMSLSDIKGVVDIDNYFEANGTGYIIMEHLEGKDVRQILKESGGRMDYMWCRDVILSVLYILREVHARGVLHRDIAPDNIFITNDGLIKLIDFGAAKYAAYVTEMTTQIVVKNGYAPIEQYSRNAPQGPYTDVYAVAATFYKMLTGQKPINAIDRLSDDKLIIPSEMGIAIPEQAENAIMVCLNVQPQYRLQSADEFIEALGGLKFVPKLETEWKLPKVKESKVNDVPKWAKLLVASIAVIVVLGGVFLTVNSLGSKGGNAQEMTYTIPDLSGKNYKEDLLEGVTLIPKYVYDPDNDGEIISQSLAPRILPSGKYGDIEVNEGKASGTMTVHVASKDYVAYSDIKDKWNMHADQMKEDIGLKDTQMDVRKEELGPYNTIKEIKIKGKETLTADKINADTEDDYIRIADIETVSYYAKDFFYWEKFGDYVGENINDIRMQPVYKLDSGERTEDGTGDITDDPAIVDAGWYSFDNNDGYIFRQNVDPDARVDCSGELDKAIQPLLCVVGEGKYITHNGTGKSMKESLQNLGFTDITFEGSMNENHEVQEVQISYTGDKDVFYSDDYGHKFFKLDDGISFVIVTKEPATQAPRRSSPSKPDISSSSDLDFDYR